MLIWDPLRITQAEIHEGDLVRCVADRWEGRVLAIREDIGRLSLAMPTGQVRSLTADEVMLNAWDHRALYPQGD